MPFSTGPRGGGNRGQPESLSEIEFPEPRINNLASMLRPQLVDSSFEKIYFRQAPDLRNFFSHRLFEEATSLSDHPNMPSATLTHSLTKKQPCHVLKIARQKMRYARQAAPTPLTYPVHPVYPC